MILSPLLSSGPRSNQISNNFSGPSKNPTSSAEKCFNFPVLMPRVLLGFIVNHPLNDYQKTSNMLNSEGPVIDPTNASCARRVTGSPKRKLSTSSTRNYSTLEVQRIFHRHVLHWLGARQVKNMGVGQSIDQVLEIKPTTALEAWLGLAWCVAFLLQAYSFQPAHRILQLQINPALL